MIQKQRFCRKLKLLKESIFSMTLIHFFQENKKKLVQIIVIFIIVWFAIGAIKSFIIDIHFSKKYTKPKKIPDVDLELLYQHIKQEKMFDEYIKAGVKINEGN
jgi:hypothetical protein